MIVFWHIYNLCKTLWSVTFLHWKKLTIFSLLCLQTFPPNFPSVQWHAVSDEPPDTWSAPTTTSQWTSLSVIPTRGPQPSKSARLLLAPPPTTVSTFTNNPTDILRIQDVIRDTAAGTSRLQTTSGGQDRGAQYVRHNVLDNSERKIVFACTWGMGVCFFLSRANTVFWTN